MLAIKNAMLIKELKPLIIKYGNNTKVYNLVHESFIKTLVILFIRYYNRTNIQTGVPQTNRGGDYY